MDLEPGGPGNLSGTFPARLAESLSQCRGGSARGLGLRTARSIAGPGFCPARERGAPGLRCLFEGKGNLGQQGCANAATESSRLFFRLEFGFHETLPIAAGGLGILAGDHAKSASDLGLGFVGISLFYREGYFQQAFNQEQLADRILHAAQPEESADGAGVECQRRAAGLLGGDRDEPGLFSGLARERRARAGLSARHQPAGKRAALSRPDAARLRRRQHHAHHAGNSAGHRRRPPPAGTGRATVCLSHERRPCRLSDAGVDPRKNGRRQQFHGRHRRHQGRMHFHHPHAGRGRPRPVQPRFDELRCEQIPIATQTFARRTDGAGAS